MGSSPHIIFHGSETADLFTQEIHASLDGVLTRNMVSNECDQDAGFVHASIDGRPWTGTMWTRDAGVFLRELALWGYIKEACMVARQLIRLVEPNEDGFFTFPERFELGKPGSGSELDGTAAIVIGLWQLWLRIKQSPGNPTRPEIERFLLSKESPLAFILIRLENQPLIPGSGEFGGGCGISGEFYNVVQNNLVRLALLAGANFADCIDATGHTALANSYRKAAKKIEENMVRYLRDERGAWLWCIDPQTLKPDLAIINHPINKGFGGMNGVLSMSADVLGGEPLTGWGGYEASHKTFENLLSVPLRKKLFDTFGAWTHLDEFCLGYLTAPSYSHGYALQAMLLMDRMEMAGRALDFLAQATYQPFPYNNLDRDSPFFFYERIYLPGLWERRSELQGQFGPDVLLENSFDQGCGALNLVNVAEPLKIARLILGLDDYSSQNEVKIIPRIPPGWKGYLATSWPMRTPDGLVHVDISCEHFAENRQHFSLKVVEDNQTIPFLAVRLPSSEGYTWFRNKDFHYWEFQR